MRARVREQAAGPQKQSGRLRYVWGKNFDRRKKAGVCGQRFAMEMKGLKQIAGLLVWGSQ